MPYRSPVAEYKFVLAHVVGFEDVSSTETFAEATPDTVDAILTEVGKLAEDKLAPLNRNGDLYPAQLENGVVRTSKGFADGYAAIAEGGWIGLSAPADHGGMGLPLTLTCAVNDIFSGANMALGLNPLLTRPDRTSARCPPRPCRTVMEATRSRDRRSLSRGAITIWAAMSVTPCWPACLMPRRGREASACSWCRNISRTRTALSAI